MSGNIAVQYEGRYSATGVNANDVALILILGLPIGLSFAMQLLSVARRNLKGTLLQVMNLLYIPLSIFAIVLTGSRTSLIAIIPFVIFIVGTQRIKDRAKNPYVCDSSGFFICIASLCPTIIDQSDWYDWQLN